MRRGAAGRDLRPSGAPTLVLASRPSPRTLREPATLAAQADCKPRALGGGCRRCSMRHAAVVSAVAVPRRLNIFCGGPAATAPAVPGKGQRDVRLVELA